MTKQRKTLGNKGEDLATKHLEEHNYQIVDRNFVTKYGEIDIIAKKSDDIVLVEVKTKTNFSQGEAIELINSRKIAKLKQLARYMSTIYPKNNIRIDAIAIDWSKSNPQLNHIKNIICDF